MRPLLPLGELLRLRTPALARLVQPRSLSELTEARLSATQRDGEGATLAVVLSDRDKRLGNTLSERALSIFMAGLLPKWLGHIGSSVVLHQDAGLLYKQFRNLRERIGLAAGEKYPCAILASGWKTLANKASAARRGRRKDEASLYVTDTLPRIKGALRCAPLP